MSAAQRGATLPPGEAERGAGVCGELRLQLFLSLPAADAAPPPGVRVRLRFRDGAAADSWASVERFAGAVLTLPLHADADTTLRWLAAARTVTLHFEAAASHQPLGEATAGCDDVAPGAPSAARYPVFASGAASGAPLGHVDLAWRISIWADAHTAPAPAPAGAAAEEEGPPPQRARPDASRNLGAKLNKGKPLPAAARRFAHPADALPAARGNDSPRAAAAAAQPPEAATAAPSRLAGVASLLRGVLSSGGTTSPGEREGLLSADVAAKGAAAGAVKHTPPSAHGATAALSYGAASPDQLSPPPSPPPPPPRVKPPPPVRTAPLPQQQPPLAPPPASPLAPPPALPRGALSTLAAVLLSPLAALDALADGASVEERRDARRQLATLCLAAALLGGPNAADSWALGAPGDWAVQLRPARYSFGIWPVLYIGIAVYAIFQALHSQRASPLLRRVGWPAAGALAVMACWAAAACAEEAQRGMPPSWLAKLGRAAVALAAASCLLATLVGMLRCVMAAGDHTAPFSTREHFFVVAPLSLLAGWLLPLAAGNTLTAATAALALADVAPPPVRGLTAAAAVLATGAGGTLAVLRARGNPWFAAAAAWGFCAVAVNNTRNGVRAATLRNPGAPLRPDRDVVFAAAVAAGVLAGASLVRAGFAPKRKWGPRRGPYAACSACLRSLSYMLQDST